MELATPTQLAPLRELLRLRQRELHTEVRAARLATWQSGNALHDVEDRKDEAARRQTAEVESAQERRGLAELADVEAALARLDAGTYGECLRCGEAIPMARLQVQPAARYCAVCQAAVNQPAKR
jgi:RNA polymerase-binding transcription factor DksA